MQKKALNHLIEDAKGSSKSTLGQLINSCIFQRELERAITAGDRLAARQALRSLFALLGWRWDTNALWLTA